MALVHQKPGTDKPCKLVWLDTNGSGYMIQARHAKGIRSGFFIRDAAINATVYRPRDLKPGEQPPKYVPSVDQWELMAYNNDGTGGEILFTGTVTACKEYAQRIVNSGG